MKKMLMVLIPLSLSLSCTNKEVTTAEAEKKLSDKYTPKVGVATKNEIMEEFGNPEWCKPDASGSETCRFYRKKGTKWIGEKEQKDKKALERFEQIIADFDTNGILRGFKSSAQQ